MSTHTPGPWRIQPTSMKGQFLVQGGDIRGGDGFSLQFSEGNARLVAAAPSMLTALKRLLATINPGNADSHALGCGCVIHEARAAIAKATGND